MKVATVKYTGQMQSQTVRCPSGTQYSLSNPMGGSPVETDVTSVEDAVWFERRSDVYDLEWTATGELAKKVHQPATDAKEAIEEIGYHTKKRIAGSLGLDVSNNPKQEELDEELEEAVDDLQKQMEEM